MSRSKTVDLTGNDELVHDTVIDLTIEDCCNSALLLGMVFATEQRPKRGQEYRDRVRCESLEKLGFNVKTLDDKHNDTDLRNHCNANFLDARRMLKSMQAKWSKQKFNLVILDYFFSPVSIFSIIGLKFICNYTYTILDWLGKRKMVQFLV